VAKNAGFVIEKCGERRNKLRYDSNEQCRGVTSQKEVEVNKELALKIWNFPRLSVEKSLVF